MIIKLGQVVYTTPWFAMDWIPWVTRMRHTRVEGLCPGCGYAVPLVRELRNNPAGLNPNLCLSCAEPGIDTGVYRTYKQRQIREVWIDPTLAGEINLPPTHYHHCAECEAPIECTGLYCNTAHCPDVDMTCNICETAKEEEDEEKKN